MTFLGRMAAIATKYAAWFLRGTGVTLLIALTGTLAGLAIGLAVGVVRTIPLDKNRGGSPLRRGALRTANAVLRGYIELFRGTPMIVQAMVIYYGLMEGFQIDLSPVPAGILIVSINTGAYMAEIVRAGIQSIDRGQNEAASALGMTHWQTMLRVVLPQAVRNILPAIGNEFIINIKDTSVLNVISVTELFFQTKSVKGITYRTFEAYLITALIYLTLTLSISALLRALERRLDGPSSYTLLTSSTMPDAIRKP